MVLVRGKHRCIKNDGHGPDNDLGDVVHIDAHGELFCEQGKLASPPSGQGPTEALTIGDVVYYQGQRSKVIGTEGYEGNIKRVCIEPAEYTGWVQADELAKGSK